MKILFVWPNKDSFGFKPVGLSLLMAIAERSGWETSLFDSTPIDFDFTDNTEAGQTARIFRPVDLSKYGFKKEKAGLENEFSKVMSATKPDCVAIGVLSDEVFIASRITNEAKRLYPGVPVIWGGKYPTLMPEKCLSEYRADFVCVGEGLEAFPEFLSTVEGKKDPHSIENIWSVRGANIIKQPLRPLKAGLDDLPYLSWKNFDKRHFYKPFDGKVYVSGDHMLNWGCPYHCSYCVNDFYHRLYEGKYFMRRYGVKRIICELKDLKAKYGLEFFKFHDEDFLMRPVNDLAELSEAYKSEIGLPFVIETNPKSVTAEKVRLLKDMNCVSATLGIETGDLKLRKDLLKRVDTDEDIRRAFSLLKDSDVRTSSFNLLGIPGESRDTYESTVALNKGSGVQYPNIGFFYPFEGTELRDKAVSDGSFDPSAPEASVYKRDIPALNIEGLGRDELVEMRNCFVLYVKLPEMYAPFIRRSEIKDEIGSNLRRQLLYIYDRTVFSHDGWYCDDGRSAEYMRRLMEITEGRVAYKRGALT